MELIVGILFFGLTAFYMYLYFSIFRVYFIGSVLDGVFKIFLGCLVAATLTIGLVGDFIMKYWLYILIVVVIGIAAKAFATE